MKGEGCISSRLRIDQAEPYAEKGIELYKIDARRVKGSRDPLKLRHY